MKRIFIFILFAAHLACPSFSNELIAIGLTEQSADAIAYDNIRAKENTIYCNFSDKHGRIPYGTQYKLPVNETMHALRQEYIDLVYKIKQQKDSLGQDFDINAWLPSDTSKLYTNNTNNQERKHVYATTAERINSSDSDDKIKTGVVAMLATIGTTAVADASKAQEHPNTNDIEQPQKQEIAVQENKPDSVQPKPETTVPKKEPDSIQPSPPAEQVMQDSIDELCAEFPDEPECIE